MDDGGFASRPAEAVVVVVMMAVAAEAVGTTAFCKIEFGWGGSELTSSSAAAAASFSEVNDVADASFDGACEGGGGGRGGGRGGKRTGLDSFVDLLPKAAEDFFTLQTLT